MIDGWIPTERTCPQVFILPLLPSAPFAIVTDSVTTSVFPFLAAIAPWELLLAWFLTFYLASVLFVLDLRRPAAVHLTPSEVEVRTTFGRLIRLPRESATVKGSWPMTFGSLKSPNRLAPIFLSPNQFYALFKALGHR